MHYRITAFAGAAILLAACGHGFEPSEPKDPLPRPPIKSAAPQFVYVGSIANNTISEFTVTGGSPIRTISDGVNQPQVLVLDSQGNLYSGNFGNDSITEYSPSGALIRTITSGVTGPLGMAVDSKGNVYSANSWNVSMYPPGATTPSATINTGANDVAVDGADNVYVSDPSANTVTEYTPGGASVVRTISLPAVPQAIAVDTGVNHTGELAVATCGTGCGGTGANDAAYLFAPGQTTAYATLTDVSQPVDVAYDGIGNVYIANSDWISVYALNVYGSAMEDLPCGPLAIAIDGANDLAESDLAIGVGAQVYPYASQQPVWALSTMQPWGIAATRN
jgi:hypothetical protein